jgi:protein-S-isoprenylcysteine O-methyltransferase Ste14
MLAKYNGERSCGVHFRNTSRCDPMLPLFLTNHTDEVMLIIASLLWWVPEMVLTRLRRPPPGARVDDRHSGVAVLAGIYLGAIASWAAAYRAPQFAVPVERPYLFAAGIALMLAGVAFRWYAIRVLGRYFSVVVAVEEGHTVVEQGPYRLIRHPSYSGALLTIFGYGLVFTNWLSLLLALFFPLLGYWYRMHVEEQALLKALGGDYRAYMKRTKRIIPFVI